MTHIRLSDHFTYGRLLRYTLPSIVMMIFTSLYSVVDGLFVSNLVGDLALSAVNIAFPVTMIVGAFGFMLGTGGSAIVARTLGEGKPELASRYFSMFIWCVAGLGVVLSIVTIAFIEPIMRFAGASDLLLPDCIAYGRILLAGSAVFMLQSAFQSFFSAAEKPKLGLLLSLAAGATNIVFDYVFIALLDMGVVGAALATVLGYCVGGVIPVVYFLMPRREGLRLVRTRFYGRQLLTLRFPCGRLFLLFRFPQFRRDLVGNRRGRCTGGAETGVTAIDELFPVLFLRTRFDLRQIRLATRDENRQCNSRNTPCEKFHRMPPFQLDLS